MAVKNRMVIRNRILLYTVDIAGLVKKPQKNRPKGPCRHETCGYRSGTGPVLCNANPCHRHGIPTYCNHCNRSLRHKGCSCKNYKCGYRPAKKPKKCKKKHAFEPARNAAGATVAHHIAFAFQFIHKRYDTLTLYKVVTLSSKSYIPGWYVYDSGWHGLKRVIFTNKGNVNLICMKDDCAYVKVNIEDLPQIPTAKSLMSKVTETSQLLWRR